MSPTAPLLRTLLLTAGLALVTSCGVEANTGSGGEDPGPEVTTTQVVCEPSEGGTGGIITGDDECDGPVKPTVPGPDDTEPDDTKPDTTEPDGPEERDLEVAYHSAIEDAVDGDPAFATIGVSSGCLADEWMTILTPEQFQDAGVEPEDLTATSLGSEIGGFADQDLALELAGAMGTCGADYDDLLIDEFVSQGLTDEQATCALDKLPDEFVYAHLAMSLFEMDLDIADLEADARTAVASCS